MTWGVSRPFKGWHDICNIKNHLVTDSNQVLCFIHVFWIVYPETNMADAHCHCLQTKGEVKPDWLNPVMYHFPDYSPRRSCSVYFHWPGKETFKHLLHFLTSSGVPLYESQWWVLAAVQIFWAFSHCTCCWIALGPLPQHDPQSPKSFMAITLGLHQVLFLLPTHAALPLTDGVKLRG